MAELTKEWLQQTIAELEEERDAVPGVVNVDAAMALAAMKLALSSLEAKDKIPELRQVIYHFRDWNEGFPVERFKADYVISWMLVNYPPAQQAPVSVPDERYQHLSELYHAQEKRLFKLAQRINGASFDKYAYSPSQAIDVLESAIFGEREDDCRAAMLQGADGALTNEDTNRVGELVMWVKRLAHSLRKANPDSKLQSDAMDYLSRKGLIGVEDILR
ncbi:hypothetical protein [Enterobacter hormaechei]|uniref:hypothetical protein n=1 Tax=Enterobacter hormaechei TaxID=158836 RepID=UPI001EF7F9E3|nr:hypothetical protein [Enterobacter hormaechei]